MALSTLTWSKIGANPKYLEGGNSVVINSKVYCRGGWTEDYIVYCYDPSQDNWTTLPPLPVKWFGLGQVNGKLVAIGGAKSVSFNTSTPLSYLSSNTILTYDEQSMKWEQNIPPMPTARRLPGVLSLQSALVVAGGAYYPKIESRTFIDRVNAFAIQSGYIQIKEKYTNVVEIFKPDTSQWYTTESLPTACRDISLVAIGNTCYALGGFKDLSRLNQALHASVDHLLYNAVLATQTSDHDSAGHQLCTSPVWNTLINTPTNAPIAAVLGKYLIALSGDKIRMYVPSSESWDCIGELPSHRDTNTAVAVVNLSPREILLFAKEVVYKGTLNYLTI